MEVFFCDRCSSRVSEGDLAEGRAIQVHTFVLCKACWANSEVREAIERKAAEAAAAGQAARRGARPPSGIHRAQRAKTPRPPSGRRTPVPQASRRTPSGRTPVPQAHRRTPSGRTPVPQGHRRTPGRTSPVHLERVQHHATAGHHHRDAPATGAKVAAFVAVGLTVGLLAVFFAGAGGKPVPVRSDGGQATGTRNAAGTHDSAAGAAAVSGGGAAAAGGGVDGGAAGGGPGIVRGGGSDDDMADLLYLPAEAAPGAVPGLRFEVYDGSWQSLPTFDAMTPAEAGTAPNFAKVGGRAANYALRFAGYVDVPVDGRYTFYVNSDDGSRLWIGGRPVVDNDGSHAAEERAGTAHLRSGRHRVTLEYFQGDGPEFLEVTWAGPGIGKGRIPDGRLLHRAP